MLSVTEDQVIGSGRHHMALKDVSAGFVVSLFAHLCEAETVKNGGIVIVYLGCNSRLATQSRRYEGDLQAS
jgi:formylmethanofuran dehydrogenase subunit B